MNIGKLERLKKIGFSMFFTGAIMMIASASFDSFSEFWNKVYVYSNLSIQLIGGALYAYATTRLSGGLTYLSEPSEVTDIVKASFENTMFRIGFFTFLLGAATMLLLAVNDTSYLPTWVLSYGPWFALAVSACGMFLMLGSKLRPH